MPQLDPTWFASQLFWLAISITVLYVLLSRAVLPPLVAAIASRQGIKNADLTQAQALKDAAESAREEYERSLSDARIRAQKLFADAELAGKEAADKAMAELNRSISKQTADAESRLDAKKQELLAALKPAAAELAALAAEKLTHHKANPEAARAFIQKYAE